MQVTVSVRCQTGRRVELGEYYKHEAKLSLGYPHSTFGGHVMSLVTWPFDSLYVVSYWWSFETSIFNGFRDIQRRMWLNGWHDLETTSKQRSRSFILVPIDFSYTTSYRLSI